MQDDILFHVARNVTKFFQGNKTCDLDRQTQLTGLDPIEDTWQ